jgi:hypothetical protein
MVIHFTNREMQRAWRDNYSGSSSAPHPKTNAHRLLLFYAVECGLKALIMKRQNASSTDLVPEIYKLGHDLNKLLDHLRAGGGLRLKQQYKICDLKKQNLSSQRNFDSSEINQIWRYGGQASETFFDKDIEESLSKIADWIKKQI